MAYRSRVRRYRRRRSTRPSRLSTRNIFSNRSARSQANQIYALRRRVSALANRTRPQTFVVSTGASTFQYSNKLLSEVYKTYPGIQPTHGDKDNQSRGDFIRVKSLTWYFTFEYYNTMKDIVSNPDSLGATIRIIVGQFKRPVSWTTVPLPQDIISNFTNSGADYTQLPVAPLVNGITTYTSILADKSYTITYNRNQLLKKIRVRPRNYRYDEDGNVNNCWVLIVVSGLHNDTEITEYVQGTVSDKLVYTNN
uniref:Capsid protein n=1 Tax=Syrmaticus ellioti CRESS-DNA-virus sp. TaxID=2815058 RepID=A0A8A4XC75_9VIRU|nr:MAG: capsid protein [Syrmaticus ellioti CRESS-DNA-virus sp.]